LDIKALIDHEIQSGKPALDENVSKQILNEYGVPVASETVAPNRDKAVEAARAYGFPVVLKGLGAELMHKTEMGLVHLNLENEAAVTRAADLITERAGDKLEGILVQPQIKGKREFVAGLFQDAQFGPVVMFGLGGVFTEALSDVVFRLAPLSEADARQMLSDIKAKALLDDFRGEKGADRDSLVKALVGLSKIGVDYPEISEIDINPMIVTSDGEVCAVDAMMALSTPSDANVFAPPVDPNFIKGFFDPKAIAFVGASSGFGKWGHLVFIQTASGGYKGDIYLVNPKGGTIAGRTVYTSVTEIPGEVDMAVVTVPAAAVPALIPQFKEKGIKSMLLISSGFGEVGDDGKKLEKELVDAAREAGILILGANTMGVCNPHAPLFGMGSGARPLPGATSVVAQSGNMGVQLLAFAEQQGIGIRGFCGAGNESMIAIEDYLDAFQQDPLTQNIILYLENVKNGRRFYESARRFSLKKPIVLLKGGQSKVGSKAAASHTGALTTDSKLFDAVCKQAGIVKVDYTMDMLDLAACFSSLPLPKGPRVGIMTLGGGWGVVTADLCAKYGLEVPELSDELIEAFDKILPPFWSKSNPIDIVAERNLKTPVTIIEKLLQWDECDAVINLGILGRKFFIKRLSGFIRQVDPEYPEDKLDDVVNTTVDFEKRYVEDVIHLMEKYQKPVIGAKLVEDDGSKAIYGAEGSSLNSVFLPTLERTVKVISHMYKYSHFVQTATGKE
jgi:acyl-CoA synthetase (NDP forming)